MIPDDGQPVLQDTVGAHPRVLIVRTGAMGDVLHALPAVTALRRHWPEATLDWVVDPRWAPLLVSPSGTGPVVSALVGVDTRSWSQAPLSAATRRSVLSLRSALRARRYHAVLDLQGTMRSAVIGRFAHAACFTGFNDPREALARPLYRQRVQREGVHVVEQNTALVNAALRLSLAPLPPLLPDTQADLPLSPVPGEAQDRPLILLAPTAGWFAKQWPPERFGLLAAALASRGYAVCINAASPGDSIAQRAVEASHQTARLAVCTLAQLISLTRRCAAVICGDSGPLHLAAALGVPAVALFGPTDPARNGPWGPGPAVVLRDPLSVTSYKRSPQPDPGLARIPVDEVLAAVLSIAQPPATSV